MGIGVQLPALGESVVEGTIARWLVKEGDRVERDQPLVEVTTDKVDAEIPAPVAGVVEKILAAEGTTVPVGAELARIAEDGLQASAAPAAAAAKAVAGAQPVAAAAPAQRATPVAKKMAEEARVDLRRVEGTGVGGRVTKADVKPEAQRGALPAAAAEAPAARPAARRSAPGREAAPAKPAFLSYQLQPGDKLIPMTPLRRLVAEHMVLSKRVSPHVGTVAEIDMQGVVRVRDQHKRSFQEDHGFSLTFLPFIVHAAVRALREYPRLNASVLEDAIVEKKDIHLGIAVETEKGLVVPVVRHADRLSLSGLAEVIEDLSGRARSKKLSADELKGGTFTISNPGRHGNLYGFAIINQPQVGILRMGEIVKRPVVREIEGEDAIVIRPIMHLALSYDHRAVDGAPANGFLHRVRELLETAEFDL
ncbi:MAG TPA: dihydrolipoamide acetyltransferase family protein [Myxococcota bacterium]|jgi:2-oxoglutarate dehydrogenase E2 component (dihydrolipoamide succinyltransferase)|nr:dihydrolipoamide acetyltransferase family protein [Myxococcota bacterium]